MSDKPVVGVDVSKHWLDLCCGGKSERIANTSEAIGAWLERIDPGLVALEPTGGWERVLLAALRERAIAFVRVHPNHLAAFRRSLGVAAKTDRIDAALILAFATDRRARQRVSPGTAEREGLRAGGAPAPAGRGAARRTLPSGCGRTGGRAAQPGGDHRRIAHQPAGNRGGDHPNHRRGP